MDYTKVKSLELEATCTSLSYDQWQKFMEGKKRADVRRINRLVKKLLPDLYGQLALSYYNPYHYFKTGRHLILVHSGIEYFMKYTL